MDNRSMEHTNELRDLLQRKLMGIPNNHLPTLTIADIVNQTPKALLLPNIPPDLQLTFFLTQRALIDSSNGLAAKDENIQHVDVTRAIFYYRLDEVHQFQRYHDSHRWNVAIFLAILTFPHTSSEHFRSGTVYFSPAARRFVIAYLGAVLEHHNTPASFDKRELFIMLWKRSQYDFFTFGTGQKKLLKGAMKVLTTAWEKELDRVKAEIGADNYERKVAKFVGVLIPGRKDQRAQVKPYAAESKEKDVKMEGDGFKLPAGTLLAALKEPLGLGNESNQRNVNTEAAMVMNTRDAITAVKECKPRVILSSLMQIFPEEEEDWRNEVKMESMEVPYKMSGVIHSSGPNYPTPRPALGSGTSW